jgi:hypothetical protein
MKHLKQSNRLSATHSYRSDTRQNNKQQIQKKGTLPSKHFKSRRLTQRCQKRQKKKAELKTKRVLSHLQRHTITNLHNKYGYVCNPDKTLTQNFNSLLHSSLNNLPLNSTYHNLCTTIQPLVGTRELLGLNLKFCIASRNFKPNIKSSIKRLAYNIRTAFHLKTNGITSASNDDYHPQIYVY